VKQNAPELVFRARLKWPAFGLAVVDITGFAGFLVRALSRSPFVAVFPHNNGFRSAGLACATDLPRAGLFDM
jgi:hypothetical protein